MYWIEEDGILAFIPNYTEAQPKTLEEAIEILHRFPRDTGCACIGGPNCCMLLYKQAASLQRGAHIVAKQLSGLVEKKSTDA